MITIAIKAYVTGRAFNDLGDIMKSTLIRFTNSKFLDSYRSGDLYLSSLSAFWDFTDGTLPFEEIAAGRVVRKDIEEASERLNNQATF